MSYVRRRPPTETLEQAAVDVYADRAQRLEIADAILANGSDDEATWLAIMERVTATARDRRRESGPGGP